ncbi:Multidrug resistance protein MdtK [BD1-7 clade bacterium]|uniref:Multidrug-efflux transporter n=1 Tax=BD1-7 clade bacterium TaxID=2029982 RepID=A0A5S9QZ90_9GAMM|nr:Multidrug resistance protein MdtK [BD1-7 clade bacterium]
MQELKKLLRLAGPILVAQLSFTAMSLVDTLVAGRYGSDDLAGVAIGGSFWLPALMFTQAVLYSVTPFVAQALGRGDDRARGHYLRQGIWLGAIVGSLVWLIVFNLGDIGLAQIGSMPHIEQIAGDYLFWIILSLPVAGAYQAIRSFVEGSGRTRPVMFVNLTGLILNIPLNYIFVFGEFGAPEMGGAGCGLATGLVLLYMLMAMVCYLRFGAVRAAASRKDWLPSLRTFLQLGRIGLPIGLTIVAEVSIFAVLALIIAPLGADVIAGHQVALSMTSQTFMLPMSVSLALTVRVGYFHGAGDWQGMMRAIKAGYLLGIGGGLMTAILLYFGANVLTGFYTDNPRVHEVAVAILFLPVLYQIPDAIQVCSAGILRGLKITRTPMLAVLIAYWGIALPIGYTLGRTDWLIEPMGARGLWLGLVIGLTLAAIFLVTITWVSLRRVRRRLEAVV